MELSYIFHSCFVLENENTAILIDYYKDVPSGSKKDYVHQLVLNLKKKLYVLITHSHEDHYTPEVFKLCEKREDVVYVASDELKEHIPKQFSDKVFFLEKLQTYKDGILDIQAFGSTDIGGSFLVEFAGKTIFHAGDLNNWHWRDEVDAEEAQGYEDAYLSELGLLKKYFPHINIVFFPIDPRLGREYMLGAKQFLEEIRCDFFAPMHFQDDFEKAMQFRVYAEEHDVIFLEWHHAGETYEIDKIKINTNTKKKLQ